MDDDKSKNKKTQHKLFKLTILVIVAVFFYLIYSFIRVGFYKSKSKEFNFEENKAIYSHLLKNNPNSFYISDVEIPVEKCNVESFYSIHVANNKPCVIENKNSPFLEKTNFVLNKSKILDDGFLELKKLIDLRNLENKNPFYFKKELIGVMNMLGTPKVSSALTLDNMQMEFSTRKHFSKAVCDNSEYIHFQIEGNAEVFLSHIYNINSLKPYRAEKTGESKSKLMFREILSDSDLEKIKRENKTSQVYKAKLSKGDLLFIPSFYFKQIKSIAEVNANILYKFKTHSRILNSIMISLFDENLTES